MHIRRLVSRQRAISSPGRMYNIAHELRGGLTHRLRASLRWPIELEADVKLLFQGALILLAVSTLMGMVEGQNRLTLSTDLGDAHTDAGTLGWLTLGAIAFAVMLFAPRLGHGRPTQLDVRLTHILSVLAVVSTFGYTLAAIVGYDGAIIAGSAVMLLMAVAFVGWLGMRIVQTRLESAHLAMLLSALVLVLGATVGFLLEVQEATMSTLFPDDTAIVQPIVLDAGYLLLVSVALVQWSMLSVTSGMKWTRLSLPTVLAVAMPFLALCVLTFVILMNMAGPIPIAAALDLATAIILCWKVWPMLLAVRWRERSVRRYFALAAIFLPLYLVLFVYVLVRVSLGSYTSFGSVPVTTTAGIDHLLFIGVLSNALFGLLALVTRDNRRFWPATDDVIFWGMNVGLVGLVAGFLAHNGVLMALLQGLFSPILGASIFVGVVAYTVRLRTVRVRLVPPPSWE
ncbi:MAG TPA: hypothetical protein VF120_10560 [Ktedonobacterales bacterium]